MLLGKSPKREGGRCWVFPSGVMGSGSFAGSINDLVAEGWKSFSATWEKAESMGRGDMSIRGDDMGD